MLGAGITRALGLPFDVTVAVALVAGLSLFVMAVLRHEAQLPLTVSLLFVPVVVGVGFGLAVAIHLYLAVSMLHSAGVLGVGLVGLVVLYEWLNVPASPRV